jgi:outer membrane protein assembly factor BamB
MPAPLAVSGKLFHQGMNRMVALDSYNGTVLWSLEIPELQRVNLPRDASNWCTDRSSLYVAVRDRCWVIDHPTGDLKQTYSLPGGEDSDASDWGYLAQLDGVLFGSIIPEGTVYTDFWGGASWYDKTSGAGTGKVCSDSLFAYDLETDALLWQYQNGVVINTTLAARAGRLYFVASRNAAVKQQPQRRLNDPHLWADQWLVALDARTGQTLWEVPIDTVDGIVVFFLGCTDRSVLITSSAQGQYHLYAYDANSGKQIWTNAHKWPSDNHSGHMQHAVLFDSKVYLEPCGYDLATGKRITTAVGRHEGCATYCGVKNALLYRGQSRRISLWDINTNEVTSWYNLRPSCWLSTIAADGMVILPEGGGGCSCGNWLETSLAFSPAKTRLDSTPPVAPR